MLDTTRTDRKRGCYISNCVIDVSSSFILFMIRFSCQSFFFSFGLDNNYQQLDCPTSGARNRFFSIFSYGKLLAAADCIGKGFFSYSLSVCCEGSSRNNLERNRSVVVGPGPFFPEGFLFFYPRAAGNLGNHSGWVR